MRIAQNLTLKLKLDLRTYNFHQNSTFSGDYFKTYDEITSHALTFCTYTFYAYFYNLKRFISLATRGIAIMMHKIVMMITILMVKISQNHIVSIKIIWH